MTGLRRPVGGGRHRRGVEIIRQAPERLLPEFLVGRFESGDSLHRPFLLARHQVQHPQVNLLLDVRLLLGFGFARLDFKGFGFGRRDEPRQLLARGPTGRRTFEGRAIGSGWPDLPRAHGRRDRHSRLVERRAARRCSGCTAGRHDIVLAGCCLSRRRGAVSSGSCQRRRALADCRITDRPPTVSLGIDAKTRSVPDWRLPRSLSRDGRGRVLRPVRFVSGLGGCRLHCRPVVGRRSRPGADCPQPFADVSAALIGRVCAGLFGGDSLNGALAGHIGPFSRQFLLVLLLNAPERHATAAKDLPHCLGVQTFQIAELGRSLLGRGVAQLLFDVRQRGGVMSVDLRLPRRCGVAGHGARSPPVGTRCRQTRLLIAAGSRGILTVGDNPIFVGLLFSSRGLAIGRGKWITGAIRAAQPQKMAACSRSPARK